MRIPLRSLFSVVSSSSIYRSSLFLRVHTGANERCIEASLEQYVIQSQFQSRCTSFSSQDYLKQRQEALESLRYCRELFMMDQIALGEARCKSDDECNSLDGKFKGECNVITNRCIPSREREIRVLDCVVDTFDIYTEFFMKEQFKLPGRKNDTSYRRKLYESLLKDDCLDEAGNSVVRSHYGRSQSESILIVHYLFISYSRSDQSGHKLLVFVETTAALLVNAWSQYQLLLR